MRRRGYFIFACILALLLVGCGHKEEVQETNNTTIEEGDTRDEVGDSDTVVENTDNDETKTTTEEKTTNNTEETIQNPSTGNNNTTTKPSTGSTGNTGSTNNSGNTGSTTNNNTNSGTTTQPSTPAHTHSWTEVKETVVVQEAWVEDVYGWRTICGKCGLDMTDMNTDDKVVHSSSVCQSRYSAKYIKYDEIHHPAVTEEQVTGYKCECGATKK
ncbi:MAG: hypothetical protein IJA19_04945 [Clostridia bacterium]|nr:hypothetical protein [Clostridia bacterium]